MLQLGKHPTHAFKWNKSYELTGGALAARLCCHTSLLSMNLNNSLTANLKPERSLLLTHNGGYEAGNLTPDITPCLSLFALFCTSSSFPGLAGSLWQVIIFSWEALISLRPLTSLDAALSGRFPPQPRHTWQTLTKPQICAESSIWFLSSVLPLCAVCHVLCTENH